LLAQAFQVDMNFMHASGITSPRSWLIALLLCSSAANASAASFSTASPALNLPELPDAQTATPHFGLNKQQAKFGYDDTHQVWDARLDEFAELKPSLTLDYGKLLTDRLGAGVAVHHEINYSNVWVNGIYAPAQDLRLQVAGGQLRAATDSGIPASNANEVLQNSYLLGAKRYWKDGLLSDFGISTYAVEASTADNPATAGADELAPGRQQGNTLNLSLQPLPGSRIELSRETRRLTYYFGADNQDQQYLVSNRVHFSQRLDDCLRLQGGYSTDEETRQIDLKLARKKWFFSVSHTQDGSSNDTTVGVGYTLPLGRTSSSNSKCASQPDGGAGFGSLIDSTVKRPNQFPVTPLTADSSLD